MADDLDSRLKAWEARMAAKREEERVRVDAPLVPPPLKNARDIALGAATTILVFPPGFEVAYDQHLAFSRTLKVAGVYPALKVYGLAAPPGGKPSPRLILITGTVPETQKLPEAFYTREAETFVARQLGGDWNAINPAASVANVADPGGPPPDLKSFEAVMAEIRAGRFEVSVEL
jgi:hypothetical protein